MAEAPPGTPLQAHRGAKAWKGTGSPCRHHRAGRCFLAGRKSDELLDSESFVDGQKKGWGQERTHSKIAGESGRTVILEDLRKGVDRFGPFNGHCRSCPEGSREPPLVYC